MCSAASTNASRARSADSLPSIVFTELTFPPALNTGQTKNSCHGKKRIFTGIGVTESIRRGDCLALDAVKKLLDRDWKETGIKLAGYAAFRARNLAWRTGSTEALAKGLMPDDIAAQAILSVISGERTWDPERGPLLPFLKCVVDSLLNHLAESSDNRRLERLLDDTGGSPRGPTDYRLVSNDLWGTSTASAIDAEAPSQEDDGADQKTQQLFAVVRGKPELLEVLRAIVDFGEAKPRHIAARIGKSVNHVNNCLKRLRRLALKLTANPGQCSASGGAPINP